MFELEVNIMTFSKWASRSLFGHLVFFQIIVTLPLVIYLLYSNYTEGTLTVAFTLKIVLAAIASGAFVAFGFWHTVTLPMMRRVQK
jgi:hypothetical protein